MLPSRDALIGVLVSAKLHARRFLRHWRARARLQSRTSQTGLLDTGIVDGDLDSKCPTRKSQGARLPAQHMGKPTVESYIVVVFLLILAFSVRVWRIEDPPSVVFDELHFGTYFLSAVNYSVVPLSFDAWLY